MDEKRNLDRTWLCTILFTDIVNYSSQSIEQQLKWKRFFNDQLGEALKGVPTDDRVVLDTGDGAAICFLGDPEPALLTSLTMQSAFALQADQTAPGARLRLGINLGPVKLVRDINGNLNALGDGINVAQRIMSFAAPNQVLVSQSYFEVVSRLSDDYSKLFRCIGVRQDKHVREYSVYELSSSTPSDAATPPPAPEPPQVAAAPQPAPARESLPPPPVAASPAPASQRRSLTPMIIAAALVVLLIAGAYFVMRGKRATANGSVTTGSAGNDAPLVKAIEEGRLDDARALLAKGADVNAANKDGITPLMQAATGSAYLPNNTPAVTLVLEHNPKIDAQDQHGRTALHHAIEEGKDEVVRLLLARKANVNQKASDGASPLLAAITYGKLNAARLLMNAGADIDLADAQGTTPLMAAAEGTAYMPNNAPLVEALLEKNANIEAQDVRGRTPLYRAASEGKLDAVRLLLDKKANPNARASDGSTPLLEAVTYGRMPVVELLLQRGAQIDLADASSNTPLMVAAEGTAYMPNNAPFVTALLATSAKVDAQDARGRSPLYRASAEGKEDAMRALVEKKANVNLKASDGSTPLLEAVTYGKMAAATLLIAKGADVNEADASGNTPLMVAAEGNPYIKNSAEFISLLLAHGAKPDAADGRGRTALARATEAKNTAAIAALNTGRK